MYFFSGRNQKASSSKESVCKQFSSPRMVKKILILLGDQSINSVRKGDGTNVKWLTDKKKSNKI